MRTVSAGQRYTDNYCEYLIKSVKKGEVTYLIGGKEHTALLATFQEMLDKKILKFSPSVK